MISQHGLGGLHRAHQVHVHHGLEIRDLHLGEALVAQDAGIGDQDVDAAQGVHGLLDHVGDAGVVGDGGAVGDRLAAGRLDLVDHLCGRFRVSRPCRPPRRPDR